MASPNLPSSLTVEVLTTLLDSMPPATLVSRLRSALDPVMGHTHEEIVAFLNALKGLGLERAVSRAQQTVVQNRAEISGLRGATYPGNTICSTEAPPLAVRMGAGGETRAVTQAPIIQSPGVNPFADRPGDFTPHATNPPKPTKSVKEKELKVQDKPIAKLPFPFPQTTPAFLFASPAPSSTRTENGETSAGLEAAHRLHTVGKSAIEGRAPPVMSPTNMSVPGALRA